MSPKIYCTVMVDGQELPVTNAFDIDGNELSNDDSLELVYSLVAKRADDEWLAIKVVSLSTLRPIN